ncbi:hypothetical protein AHAS_Ahas20G0217300 [Arachis hypogaea]
MNLYYLTLPTFPSPLLQILHHWMATRKRTGRRYMGETNKSICTILEEKHQLAQLVHLHISACTEDGAIFKCVEVDTDLHGDYRAGMTQRMERKHAKMEEIQEVGETAKLSSLTSSHSNGYNFSYIGDIEERKIGIDSNNDMHFERKESVYRILNLSSDSESCLDRSPKKEIRNNQSPCRKGSKGKSSQKPIQVEEDHSPVKGKKTKGSAKERVVEIWRLRRKKLVKSSLRQMSPLQGCLLVLSEKVQHTKALVECQGDSIDLSGDVGAVGRVIISDSASRDQEMQLDLKETIYKTSIVPCRTFCVVSFGQSEVKIEAIMNDFIQLEPQSNVYEAETMVEGTLDGFAFDSDEEAGKMPKGTQTDQNEHAKEQTHSKSKGKGDKKIGAEKKRGRSTGGKPQPKTGFFSPSFEKHSWSFLSFHINNVRVLETLRKKIENQENDRRCYWMGLS